jgi:hypothetical protein
MKNKVDFKAVVKADSKAATKQAKLQSQLLPQRADLPKKRQRNHIDAGEGSSNAGSNAGSIESIKPTLKRRASFGIAAVTGHVNKNTKNDDASSVQEVSQQ